MTKKSVWPQQPAKTEAEYPSFEEGRAAVNNFMGKSLPNTSKEKNKPTSKKDNELMEKLDGLATMLEEVEKSPEITLDKVLDKYDLKKSDAEEIVDCLMQGKEYQKTYKLTKDYNVTFKSRLMSHQNQTLEALEAYNPSLPMTTGSLISQHNLAQSIVRVERDTSNESGSSSSFENSSLKDRLDWVSNLSEHVGRLLSSKLAQFDNMLLDLTDEGIIENF